MGYHLLPADSPGYAHYFRPYPVGVLFITAMGRCMGQMDYTLSDGSFLRSHALLRGIISMCNSLIISIVILQNTST